MNSSNYGVHIRGINGQQESDFYGMLYDIIQLEYTGIPLMKLVLFKCDWFDNTPYIESQVDKNYEIVEVRKSKRYIKAYDPFIFAQQEKQVYYTTYPEGHRGWLAVMKTKVCNRITDNIVSETEQEAPYQDDELVGLQEVLEVDLEVINESLADVDGGGEEIDADLLKQLDLVEPDEDECILSENDIESDFDDTNTS